MEYYKPGIVARFCYLQK